MRQRTLGADAPRALDTQKCLGHVLLLERQHAEAEAAHPDIAHTLIVLATVVFEEGAGSDAVALVQEAQGIQARRLRGDHPEVVVAADLLRRARAAEPR